jgi:hypothetical protein
VQLVVHRIEITLTDEVQVLAVRVERGSGIAQRRPGSERRLARFELTELDGGRLGGIDVTVGDPTTVE